MSYTDNYYNHFLIILFYTSFTAITYSQVDTKIQNESNLLFNPSMYSIQVDATSIILMHQIGGQFDFNVLHSKNENVSIGTRISVEHYYLSNFVEKIDGSPFTNYNLYGRLSSYKDDLYASVLGGVTYYTSNDHSSSQNKYLFRAAFEIKYGDIIGLLLKGSTSLVKNSSFIGMGIWLGYNKD